jgi:uncharacterized protein YdhG (YjbR/CyaY superfamily)
MPRPKTVDAYIAAYPKSAQIMMRALRRAITAAVPDAEERLSYQMPFYYYHGRLAYIGAFKDHVSLFITGVQTAPEFKDRLKPYVTSKGTIQFPLGKTIPTALVKKMVRSRAVINLARQSS